ncbi:capping complex subunit for YIEGIA [Paenibacillus pasadenensis]|uniref:Uncharacterized protein n=1 Tax=Paenibacillus pasadenensis TaxID=217090 RepID=A0A2N5N5L1_9BACL|nr:MULTISPECIES: hypothetical protein [Paenibacillus]PLT45631.1 hypothetical protein B8V81_4062 [Paenibacillus pasadenensis]QGG56079.1 hypothetical protein GE073_11170 [Paenibacillus sp. B01]
MARIVAVVSSKADATLGGGAPVFIENEPEKAEQTAFLLEKILDANAHDLKNGSYILVDHKG